MAYVLNVCGKQAWSYYIASPKNEFCHTSVTVHYTSEVKAYIDSKTMNCTKTATLKKTLKATSMPQLALNSRTVGSLHVMLKE